MRLRSLPCHEVESDDNFMGASRPRVERVRERWSYRWMTMDSRVTVGTTRTPEVVAINLKTCGFSVLRRLRFLFPDGSEWQVDTQPLLNSLSGSSRLMPAMKGKVKIPFLQNKNKIKFGLFSFFIKLENYKLLSKIPKYSIFHFHEAPRGGQER